MTLTLTSAVLQRLDHILSIQLKKVIIIMLLSCLIVILKIKTIMEKATLLQVVYGDYELMVLEPKNVQKNYVACNTTSKARLAHIKETVLWKL